MAIQSIYRDLEYAKSLIKGKGTMVVDDPTEESEESWTFVGDDNDPEVIRGIHDWEPMAQSETASNNNVLSGSEASGHEISAAGTGA
jgi:sterol 3beta-glucosyltransferase